MLAQESSTPERPGSDVPKPGKPRTTVKHLPSSLPSSPSEVTQIETLIDNLTRSVQLLSSDIDSEETRVRVRDVADPAYPILAQHLRSRRANLNMTIAALQARLQAARARENRYSESLAG